MNVDLPEPFGPVMAYLRPGWKVVVTSSNKIRAPKRMVRSFTEIKIRGGVTELPFQLYPDLYLDALRGGVYLAAAFFLAFFSRRGRRGLFLGASFGILTFLGVFGAGGAATGAAASAVSSAAFFFAKENLSSTVPCQCFFSKSTGKLGSPLVGP